MTRGLFQRLKALQSSVRSSYGDNWSAYFKFLYYSVLKPAKFVVLCADASSLNVPADTRIALNKKGFRVSSEASQLHEVRKNGSLPTEFFADAKSPSAEFYLALSDADKPAYIHWVFDSNCCSTFLHLRPTQVEINYVVTLPSYRGNRLCRFLVACTLADYIHKGAKQFLAVVHADNIASLRAFEQSGFQIVATTWRILRYTKKVSVVPAGI